MTVYEAEVIEGLEEFVSQELRQLDPRVNVQLEKKGIVQFESNARLNHLLSSRTMVALYTLQHFDLPRPKALLGHQHFHRILEATQIATSLFPENTYQTLYIDAAGSDSSVMQRIKQELAQAAHLQPSDTKGDLHIRIRRGLSKQGWDVLVRLSPRPLATRDWRVANFEGALNGTVAHIMTSHMLMPSSSDVILNIASGSGSLLIERAQNSNAKYLVGVDTDPFALACAVQNIHAAQLPSQIQLLQTDARQLPFASGTFNRIFADLPFGQRVGSHDENLKLYPEILRETARVAARDAQFALITHEKRLMQRILSGNSTSWRVEREYAINLSGLHPQIYILKPA